VAPGALRSNCLSCPVPAALHLDVLQSAEYASPAGRSPQLRYDDTQTETDRQGKTTSPFLRAALQQLQDTGGTGTLQIHTQARIHTLRRGSMTSRKNVWLFLLSLPSLHAWRLPPSLPPVVHGPGTGRLTHDAIPKQVTTRGRAPPAYSKYAAGRQSRKVVHTCINT